MKVLLWFNTLVKFRWWCFSRRFNLCASVLLISLEPGQESDKTLILNLSRFLSVTCTGKTCRNGPRRFDLENEFTLPSVGILFCVGDCFLLSELPFWLSKGSLCVRVWCFCLQPSRRHLNSNWHFLSMWALDKQFKHNFCLLIKFFLSIAVFCLNLTQSIILWPW